MVNQESTIEQVPQGDLQNVHQLAAKTAEPSSLAETTGRVVQHKSGETIIIHKDYSKVPVCEAPDPVLKARLAKPDKDGVLWCDPSSKNAFSRFARVGRCKFFKGALPFSNLLLRDRFLTSGWG